MAPANEERPLVAVLFDALFLIHQDHERMAALAEVSDTLADDDFWFLFRAVWEANKVLFTVQAEIRNMLTQQRLESIHRHGQHNDVQLKLWRERIRRRRPLKIYRGCDQQNATGFSWTTSRKIAEFYARETGSRDPLVAIARIDPLRIIMLPDSIMAKVTAEVVAFSEHVKVERWEPVPAAPVHPGDVARRRALAFGLGADLHIAAIVKKSITTHKSTQEVAHNFEEESAYLAGLGFKKRPAFLAEIASGIRDLAKSAPA